MKRKTIFFLERNIFFDSLSRQGISAEAVLQSIRDVINWDQDVSSHKREDLFNYDFVYYDSFFENSVGFLTLFQKSSFAEQKEFKDYIVKTVVELKETITRRNILFYPKNMLVEVYIQGLVLSKMLGFYM